MKVGFVAILGRPNAGKSTLLNALLSKKVSIVSYRAQTTRDAISGILNEKGMQIVFVDTPGIFQGNASLDRHMKKTAFESARDVDAILYLIDGGAKELDTDFKIISSIHSDAPIILVLNKIDLLKAEEAAEKKAAIAAAYPNYLLIEASILENFGIKEIKEAILPHLSEGEPFYPEDMLTDKDQAYQAKEVIRGKLLHFLREEVPHQAAVRIDSLKKDGGVYKIHATILVDKPNHKGIVIGRGGEMIKKISMSSRTELEKMWHEKIALLSIEVEDDPGWRNDIKKLQSLGYGDDGE